VPGGTISSTVNSSRAKNNEDIEVDKDKEPITSRIEVNKQYQNDLNEPYARPKTQ